ncbi:unnamed protein product [Rhizophagus irregularis]|nr:unnamed protein product [Rhizophagus irregularis]CAB5354341.1 unnamed protein product [Rhizophagus irregularis]
MELLHTAPTIKEGRKINVNTGSLGRRKTGCLGKKSDYTKMEEVVEIINESRKEEKFVKEVNTMNVSFINRL